MRSLLSWAVAALWGAFGCHGWVATWVPPQHRRRHQVAVGRSSSGRGRGLVVRSLRGAGGGRPAPVGEPVAADSFFGGGKGPVLYALALAYTSNQWCRSVLFSTVRFESTDAFRFVNAALHLDESQYALLSTLAFNALFSAASLVAGAVVDEVDAGLVTATACAVWSVATVGAGAAPSFEALAACRAAQGIAMAATAPAGYAFLAKTFPPAERARANSAYASAVSVGGALASASVLLDERLGWRATFQVAGLAGLAIAVFALVQLVGKEDLLTPRRDAPEGAVAAAPSSSGEGGGQRRRPEVKGKGRFDFASSPIVLAIYGTTAVRFCAGFSIGVWVVPVLRAHFPDRGADLGLAYAAVVGAGGAVSAVLGGILADAAAQTPALVSRLGPAAPRALVPALGSLAAAPLWVAALASPTFEAAVGLLALEFIVAECWIGPTTALLGSAVPEASRGTALGTFTALSLVGNLAPLAIGFALANPTRVPAALADTTTLVSIVVAGAYVAATAGFSLLTSILAREHFKTNGDDMKSA